MKYLFAVIVAMLILNIPSQKSSEMQNLKPHDTILAFGDSLTYGYGANTDESYPVLLSKLSGCKVINAGINGDTSAEGLERLALQLEDESIKLMILCFGGNDILQRLSMDSLKSNLKAMIHLAKAKGIDTVLIAVPNISIFGLSPLGLYQEVADEEDIPLITGVLSDILSTPALKNDQIHPNALGYKQMADRVYEGIRGYIDVP